MRSLQVVDVHGLIDHPPGLCKVHRALQQKLTLENPIDAFSQRILVAVIAISHGARQSVLSVNRLVLIRAILNTSVRMVDQSLAALATFERHLQGQADLPRTQTVMNMMSHDLSGVGIGNQTQVHKPTVGWHIGDVRHPDLLSRQWLNLLISSFEQIGVAVKPVVAVSGLVIRPLGRHEHV